MPKVITAEQFTELLAPGKKVYLQGCTAEPLTLQEAMAARPECADGIEFVGVPLPSYNRFDPAALHPNASMTTFFMTPQLRRSQARDRIRFIPTHYSNIYRQLRGMPDLDIAVFQGAQASRDGFASYGLSSEHAPGALEIARTVVLEANAAVPFTQCWPPLPLDKIDYIVETDRKPDAFPSPELTDDARAIGQHAASLIRDGDTLQIGIGKLMSAAMQALTSHRDLGFHSGLMSDETLALVEAGALTGARKSREQGLIVAGAVFGSPPLHAFAADDSVRITGVQYTHEVPIIASVDNFVSINACMKVDLHGQVVADHINGRQISAPGGYADFQRGARLSNGGRSIVLMNATAADGTVSNVIPSLPAGSVVTGVRGDTDFVVSEYGSADLRAKDEDGRAAALIEIAAPQFREELARAWHAARDVA